MNVSYIPICRTQIGRRIWQRETQHLSGKGGKK